MLKNVLRLFFVSILVFSCSCAKKRVEIPVYEGVNIRDVLLSKAHITGIETTFSVTFERDDTEMKGEGALNMSKNGDMNMRIYSFGFPVFQISSADGLIKSNPVVDRNKGTLLTYGPEALQRLYAMDAGYRDVAARIGAAPPPAPSRRKPKVSYL